MRQYYYKKDQQGTYNVMSNNGEGCLLMKGLEKGDASRIVYALNGWSHDNVLDLFVKYNQYPSEQTYPSEQRQNFHKLKLLGYTTVYYYAVPAGKWYVDGEYFSLSTKYHLTDMYQICRLRRTGRKSAVIEKTAEYHSNLYHISSIIEYRNKLNNLNHFNYERE